MSQNDAKLEHDVTILEAMSGEIDEYLRHEVLFWPLMQGNLPRLTFGGILMRIHRLTQLKHLLPAEAQIRCENAIRQFNEATAQHIVAVEQRCQQELAVRLRQWQTSIQEWQANAPSVALYAAGVEVRVMVASLLEKLRFPPFQLDSQLVERVRGLDQALRGRWQSGSFVWPETWQSAYPQSEYWWLYGLPGGGQSLA